MFEHALNSISTAHKIVVIQAENPDGDSLGSALALEELLGELGKEVTLHCPVDIPKYLRYIPGWDRVVSDFDSTADLSIIVDTTADILLSKTLEIPGARHFLESHPVLVIDHHTESEATLSFPHTLVSFEAVSTSHVILKLAEEASWAITQPAAEAMLAALLSDSLGLTTPNVTSETYEAAATLTRLGAMTATIEERRREYMKKAPEILAYKGRLLERIEYYLDGALAVVHIPFDEIERYSDKYNPSVLVLDEMRLVEGVELAVAIKTYPDGKLTGKLRANIPIAEQVAGYFGGGGHVYASGFRIYESIDAVMPELLEAAQKGLESYHAQAS